jgi:cyclic pyranopterin phosphate synthase
VTIGVRDLGITAVRFTGGEPLVRPGLVSIISRVRALSPGADLSITTNGIGLAKLAGPLAAAGLDRVNVSLDSIRPETFMDLTRRDRLHDVIEGLEAASAAGLGPVKVNAVLMRGVNDDQAPELLAWALDHGYELRFIEHMPLDADHIWSRSQMVTADEILELLAATFELRPRGHDGSAPAEDFDVLEDGAVIGRVGVIASVTRPFCRDCDRLRLTADGQLRTCLFAQHETDLRGPLRAGATSAELADIIRTAVAGKQAGHGIERPDFVQPERTMSAIGG